MASKMINEWIAGQHSLFETLLSITNSITAHWLNVHLYLNFNDLTCRLRLATEKLIDYINDIFGQSCSF